MLLFICRRFVYHAWNQWFADVGLETLISETANCSERNGECNTENINRTLRRSSPSIIPSLFQLASSSFRIFRQLNTRSRLTSPVTEESKGPFLLPLSTLSEFKFCDSVIAKCSAPEGEVQRNCALNYKRWLLIKSTPQTLDCNETTTTTSG